MINRETAKQFLEIDGYPNPDSNYENELLDTMVDYAKEQFKNESHPNPILSGRVVDWEGLKSPIQKEYDINDLKAEVARLTMLLTHYREVIKDLSKY